MEVQERVPGAQAQRTSRERQRLHAATGAGERPGERVVPVDRGPRGACAPGELDRLTRADQVVGPVDGRLEVDPDALRREEPVEDADGRSLTVCLLTPPRTVEQV